MAGFLFWNLYGRQEKDQDRRARRICDSLTRLVARHPIDVLVFAERLIGDADLANALNAAVARTCHRPDSQSRRIQVWTELPVGSIEDRLLC